MNSSRSLLLLALILLSPAQCFAAEAGLGVYWPGYRNFQAGFVPSEPGLYFRNDIVFYTASAPRVVLNGLPVDNASGDVVVDVIEPIWVFPWKVFGANHAFVVTQPFVWGRLSGHVIGTDINPSDTHFAPGDTIVSPIWFGWHKKNFHYNTNLAIFIPNGGFDVHQVVNASRNFWALDPEFSVTWLNPKAHWEFSGSVGYTFSFENMATKYRSGQAFHLDYCIGKTLKNGAEPALVGYAWVQTTPDSGPGAVFGSFKSSVFGIGPAIQWKPAGKPQLIFRYYHEFAATNHLEGDQLALEVRARL